MICRGCGTEMVAKETCPSCNEAVLWKCPSCEKENDRSVHTYHARTSWAASLFWGTVSMISGTAFVIV